MIAHFRAERLIQAGEPQPIRRRHRVGPGMIPLGFVVDRASRGSRLDRLAFHEEGEWPDRKGAMDQICLVVPIQAGHASDARDFMRELESERKDDYARSEKRIGIDKEVWFIAEVPGGEALVAYMESDNFQGALEQFVASRDEFDLWFKGRFNDATGVDLNDPPEMALPELLSSYSV